MEASVRPAPQAGYEKRDAEPRGLLIFLATIAAILAAISLLLILLFHHFQNAEKVNPVVAPAFEAPLAPPAPRIQANPEVDIQNYMQSQQQILNTYGWIDRQGGIVRLPIDRAMDLLMQRGLPTRPQTAAPQTASAPNQQNPPEENLPAKGVTR